MLFILYLNKFNKKINELYFLCKNLKNIIWRYLNFNAEKKDNNFYKNNYLYENNNRNISMCTYWRDTRCVIWILSYYCATMCFKAQYSTATWIFYSYWTPIQLQCFEYASKLCFVYRCGTCLQPEVFARNRYPTRGVIFQGTLRWDISEQR